MELLVYGPVAMKIVKAHLSEYLAAVERGEEIVVARRNKPVARLVCGWSRSNPRDPALRAGQGHGPGAG